MFTGLSKRRFKAIITQRETMIDRSISHEVFHKKEAGVKVGRCASSMV